MPKAVRYAEFGGIDVLRLDKVERPVPGSGQVLVRVNAAGINISEAVNRTGAVAQPSRSGSRPTESTPSPITRPPRRTG